MKKKQEARKTTNSNICLKIVEINRETSLPAVLVNHRSSLRVLRDRDHSIQSLYSENWDHDQSIDKSNCRVKPCIQGCSRAATSGCHSIGAPTLQVGSPWLMAIAKTAQNPYFPRLKLLQLCQC